MSRKNKNRINSKISVSLLESFGFKVKKMNFYQFRITPEESSKIFDWYHTTGSLVATENGCHKSLGKFAGPEDVANKVCNIL